MKFRVLIYENVVFTYEVEADDAEAADDKAREQHTSTVKQEGTYLSFEVKDAESEALPAEPSS